MYGIVVTRLPAQQEVSSSHLGLVLFFQDQEIGSNLMVKLRTQEVLKIFDLRPLQERKRKREREKEKERDETHPLK